MATPKGIERNTFAIIYVCSGRLVFLEYCICFIMGVPKFFRWISERYPCLSEVVREYQVPSISNYEIENIRFCLMSKSSLLSNYSILFQIPEFDNLYLDMNGIIHMCSHPNDFDPHFRITEEKIFKDIFHYIEVSSEIICSRSGS